MLNQKRKQTADKIIFELYKDIAKMYSQIESYLPLDIDWWFERVNQQLDAYAGRMLSMTNSAVGKK